MNRFCSSGTRDIVEHMRWELGRALREVLGQQIEHRRVTDQRVIVIVELIGLIAAGIALQLALKIIDEFVRFLVLFEHAVRRSHPCSREVVFPVLRVSLIEPPLHGGEVVARQISLTRQEIDRIGALAQFIQRVHTVILRHPAEIAIAGVDDILGNGDAAITRFEQEMHRIGRNERL